VSELRTLRMTPEDFAGLAGCRPSPSALAVLREGQVSRRLLMLKSLADTARGAAPQLWIESGAAEGWDWCLKARATDVTAFEHVLMHPHLGVWLGRCLRLLHDTHDVSQLAVPLSRLATLGAAAALRSGLQPRLSLPAPGGLLWLPTFGMVRLPPGVATARLHGRHLRLRGRSVPLDGPQDEWSATVGPRLTPRDLVISPQAAGSRPSVVLEDCDIFRDVHGASVQPRQTPGQLSAWRASAQEAWTVISALLPERAAACAELWAALVPLHPGPDRGGRSSSAREAFGAVAVAPTPDPARLAEAVVHETAHIAFAALTDLVDLADPRDRSRHRVGWRPDPRPIGAVLTGAQAHLSLLEFWRRRAESTVGFSSREAEQRLHRYGMQVAAALGEMAGHRALTPPGARFVALMTEEAERCGFPVRGLRSSHPIGAPRDDSLIRVNSHTSPGHGEIPGSALPSRQMGGGNGDAAGSSASASETRRGLMGGAHGGAMSGTGVTQPLSCASGNNSIPFPHIRMASRFGVTGGTWARGAFLPAARRPPRSTLPRDAVQLESP
jgi:uncharacterized protein